MKKAKLIVLGLAAVVLCVALFAACGPEFWCVGGNTSGGAGKCSYTSSGGIKQCTDRCITAQGTYLYTSGGINYYSFNGSKSCDCGA